MEERRLAQGGKERSCLAEEGDRYIGWIFVVDYIDGRVDWTARFKHSSGFSRVGRSMTIEEELGLGWYEIVIKEAKAGLRVSDKSTTQSLLFHDDDLFGKEKGRGHCPSLI